MPGQSRPPQREGESSTVRVAAWMYFAVFFVAFLSLLDLYLYRVGVLPYRQLLFVGFALPPLLVILLRLGLRRGRRGRIAFLGRSHAGILRCACLLVWFSLLWVLHPTAYWGEGIQYSFYVPFYLTVFILTIFISAFEVVTRHWRSFLSSALFVLIASTFVDVFFPGTFSKSETRASGFAVNPNDAALLATSLAAALISFNRARVRDSFLLAAVGTTVFVTLSRGGLILYGLLLAGYLLSIVMASSDRFKSATKFLLSIAAAGLIAWFGLSMLVETQSFFTSTYFANRLAMFGSVSTSESTFVPEGESRVELAEQYLGIALDAPILGHGAAYDRSLAGGSPHNMYLSMWVNLGLPGLLLYSGLLVLIWMTFWRRRFLQGLMITALLALAGIFSHNLLEGFILPILLGVLLSVSATDVSLGIAPTHPRRARSYYSRALATKSDIRQLCVE